MFSLQTISDPTMPSVLPVTALPRFFLPSLFLTNRVPTTALQLDPRVSYAAYIPDSHYPDLQMLSQASNKLPVLIAIHGTSRTHTRHIEVWSAFAEKNSIAIIAPLFPAMVQGSMDLDGYHFLGRLITPSGALAEGLLKKSVPVTGPGTPGQEAPSEDEDKSNGTEEIRYDLLLLAILDEVSTRWPALDTSRIFLTGFSGGGQFVHRFMYLHPERLLGVSVGAPGSATFLDFSKAWPQGVKNIEDVFGRNVDVHGLQQVPSFAVVGGSDVNVRKGNGLKAVKGGGDGKGEITRLERLKRLAENWRNGGLNVQLEIVEGVKHDMEKLNPAVERFMDVLITNWWKAPPLLESETRL